MGLPASRLPLPALRAPRARLLRARSFEQLRRATLTPLEEARALDARALVELPLVTVLELEVPGWSGPVWVRGEDGRVGSQDPVLDRRAWLALVDAVEQDRLHAADFRALVAKLGADPSYDVVGNLERVTAEVAREAVPPLTVGRVLERIGARLFSVRVDAPTQEATLAEAS